MGTHRSAYFRTDGNSQIASGHLMRCTSIALACRGLGMEVRFLVSDGESARLLYNILDNCGWGDAAVTQLDTASYDNLELELGEVISLFTNSSGKSRAVYFLDSYFVTEKYLLALRGYTKTVYLDDLRLFDYPVDLLVNYDIIPNASLPFYKAAYQNPGRLLLGAAYTPLRPQFQGKKIAVKEHAADILVTTGGSDPYHFCLNLVYLLLDQGEKNPWNISKLPQPVFHIVVGNLNPDQEQLRKLGKKYPFLLIHENVGDMASLMEKCDLAVSAAGTTLYELCALGVPAVSFTIADNQLSAAKAFDEAGAIPWAGDLRQGQDTVFAKVRDFLEAMWGNGDKTGSGASLYNQQGNSLDLRKSVHKIMRRLVDGGGALRIAAAIQEL